MKRDQIRDTLQQIIEEELDRQFGQLSDDMVIADFGLDSVDYVSLIMRWEESFRIRLTNEELKSVTTIGSLVDLIETKTAQSDSAIVERRAA